MNFGAVFGSSVLIFFFICLGIFMHSQMSATQKMVVLYLSCYVAGYIGVFRKIYDVLIVILIQFIYTEYISDDMKKMEVIRKFRFKLLDYIYQFCFIYKTWLYILAEVLISYMFKLIIGEKYFWIATVISFGIVCLLIQKMCAPKFQTNNISQIMDTFMRFPPYQFPTDVEKEKFYIESLCEAVSLLFGEIPINRYIVTNQDSMPYINNLVDGVTVTVPNNDLSDQYPEFYEGNQVTLDDSNIRDFLQHRDTDTEFSNEGRIERQKVYMSAYVDKIKSLDESKLEDTWNSLDSMKDYLQTNITRNQYLKFIKLIRKVDFSDEDIIQLSGSDQEGEIHDEFYPDETELKKLIIQLFYEKV